MSWCTPAIGWSWGLARGTDRPSRTRSSPSQEPDPARRRRGLRRRRHHHQGQGAAAFRIRALSRGPDPLHLPAPRRGRAAHPIPGRSPDRGRGLRDGPDRRPPPAPGAHVGDRRADGAPLWGDQPGTAEGGRGVLMGGASGVAPARVVVLGAGMAGTNAAWIAAGMEAEVVIVDKNVERLRYVDQLARADPDRHVQPPGRRATGHEADLVIGAVLVPGAKAPHLVTAAMVARCPPVPWSWTSRSIRAGASRRRT